MDRQTKAALALRDAIKALVRKYDKHDHLEVFVKDLKITARDLDMTIKEVSEVQ